jgi:2-keto-4-pentenoate hydratase/2-oxohepta-3-ene-1,7-dioic acid hydratase in catechol pathway
MRQASFVRPNGEASYGLIRGDDVVDLGARLAGRFRSLLEIYRAGALAEATQAAKSAPADFALSDIAFLPPIGSPEKIICVGVNYANRNEEYRDGSEAPKYPSLFIRFPGSFVGHGAALIRPKVSLQFDYEGEIVLVIGREGRHVPRDDASGLIAGYTLANEGSVRDWIRHGKFNVTQGKNFDRSGSMGPWIVPANELPSGPLHLTTRVNGEVRQDDTTESMIFDFASLIAYITTFTTLKPGDLILTGTPTGAGARFDPPRWLVPGDVVTVEVPGIGVLSNPVADET